MTTGRYPLRTAYGYRASLAMTGAYGTTSMWDEWFFGSDGIGFGILKRWNGTSWVVNNKMKVHAF